MGRRAVWIGAGLAGVCTTDPGTRCEKAWVRQLLTQSDYCPSCLSAHTGRGKTWLRSSDGWDGPSMTSEGLE